jgi:AraC-like DNA-binding protein
MNDNRCWASRIETVEAWSSHWRSDANPSHTHDFYQISFVRQGHGRIRLGDAVVDCSPGKLVVIHPDMPHRIVPIDGAALIFDTVYLPDKVASELLDVDRSMPVIRQVCRKPFADILVDHLFDKLHRGIVECQTPIRQEHCLFSFLDRLAAIVEFEDSGVDHAADYAEVVRAREFLESESERTVTLAELAAITGISPFRLNRSFRRIVGLPPHAFHIQVRIHQARALLRAGSSITEVAFRTGFTDQPHLTRHFRRLVGMSPGEYARSARTYKTAMPRLRNDDLRDVADRGPAQGVERWTPKDRKT